MSTTDRQADRAPHEAPPDGTSPPAPPPPRRVVFLCVENSCRSQMAEAFARLHGGAEIEAHSAGSRPSGVVNPRAIAAMREVGCDLARHRSKAIQELPNVAFDVAVTMGCGDACPALRAARREDWPIPDPKEMSPDGFRDVRDQIERNVKQLLVALKGEPHARDH